MGPVFTQSKFGLIRRVREAILDVLLHKKGCSSFDRFEFGRLLFVQSKKKLERSVVSLWS